jgi:hypothetical protein
MAIIPVEILKTKFESGDFPRSTDYMDLIDTLSSASGAISSTDDLSEGATNKYFTDERAQDALGNSLGTGLSYNDTTGAISVTPNTYDSYGSASTVAGNLSTHESDTTTHGTTGNIVGTSDTQTLTNKTLTSPKINEDVILTATATELNYVDGVTSAIQTQINNKAPLADPTFTGTVSGVTKTHVGLGNVDNTSDANKPISTATQTALDLKAAIASPTFTGTPAAPLAVTGTNTTQIATTSFVQQELSVLTSGAPAALNTLDELAAALGDDSNYAATITTALGLKAPLASPTFTGTVTIPAGASISGFAPLESPTFTGTVSGVTKSHVGLGSVDNTSDIAKPVSTAQQTALDSKANLSSNNTFSGGSIFSGAVAELSTTAGIHVGIASSTPRMMFVPTGAATSENNWQIDVASGVFRWFTPGVVQMSLSSGGIVTANSFVKNSGTSSQFLKADGSSDSSTYITPTSTNTLTNKRLTGRVTTVTDASTPSPSADNDDMYILTALTQTATFAAPSGTPTQGQKLIVRVKDNGTARTLAWNAIYRASSDLSLPTTTIASKTLYLGFIYNSTDTKWDLVSRINNF